MTSRHNEREVLLSQVKEIARGLGATLAPFCEVVVHDLADPNHTIVAIHNNLSGRALGDPVTEVGLARVIDPDTPQVITNYANRFADGRKVKSTSIGIKDSRGHYVAALCLNIDLTVFQAVGQLVNEISMTDAENVEENLDPRGADAIRERIDHFVARRSTTPQALKRTDRKVLLDELRNEGLLEVRKAMDVVARHLGVSRATVYMDAK